MNDYVPITDTEIKSKGIQVLAAHLGDVEMERFIALIQREPFDYTQWRQQINNIDSLKDISNQAMAERKRV